MESILHEEIARLKTENKMLRNEAFKANKQVDFAINMLGLCLIVCISILVAALFVR